MLCKSISGDGTEVLYQVGNDIMVRNIDASGERVAGSGLNIIYAAW